MNAIIQVRNVPKDVHRALKARAAEAGMSLSEFLCRQLIALARQPTLDQVLERIRAHGACQVSEDSATAVRRERDSR